jgi:TonB family protein
VKSIYSSIVVLLVTFGSVLYAQEANTAKIEEVFTIVEQQPEYPGGMDALGKAIGENINYPFQAIQYEIQGKVYVQFVVSKTGKVTDVKVVKGIGFGCDEEAKRVVSEVGFFTPGMQRGEPVNVKMVLPILFRQKIIPINKKRIPHINLLPIDQQPKFEGGTKKMYHIIASNTILSSSTYKKGKEGFAEIRLTIEKDGSVDRIIFPNPLAREIEKEITPVIKKLIRFQPGTAYGEQHIAVSLDLSLYIKPDSSLKKSRILDFSETEEEIDRIEKEKKAEQFAAAQALIKKDISTVFDNLFLSEIDKKADIIDLENIGLDSVPEGITGFNKTRVIFLNKNHISKIPTFLLELENFEEIYLSDNYISSIPTITNKNLRLIGLAKNNFIEFPMTLILSNVEALDISNNKIDLLPENLREMKKLEFLNIENNNLESLPESLFKMKKLIAIRLKGNPIPKNQIERLKKALPNTAVGF